MTGTEMMHEALVLLNYTNPRGEVDTRQSAELMRRGLTVVNTVLADLSRIETGTVARLAALTEDIPLCDETLYDVMPYGVAMFLAQSEGDGDNQQLMAALYNQRRARVPRASERVADVVPRPWDG